MCTLLGLHVYKNNNLYARDCRMIASTWGHRSQNLTTRSLHTCSCGDWRRRHKMLADAAKPTQTKKAKLLHVQPTQWRDNQLPMASIFTKYSCLQQHFFLWSIFKVSIKVFIFKSPFLGAFSLYLCRRTGKTEINLSIFTWKQHRLVYAAWNQTQLLRVLCVQP